MEVKSLENIDIKDLLAVINLSFSDYIVPFSLNLEQLKTKISAENIKLDLSIGVYAEDKLVGFMLHALNTTNEEFVAYNAATGVVPDYRGKGLVGKMYDILVPKLENLGVKQMVLEVIEGNHPAIRVYEKMGYTIHRKLDCFKGKVPALDINPKVDIKNLKETQWELFKSFWDIEPSWQNDIMAVSNSIEFSQILGAYINDALVGYAIYNPTSKKINQVAVAPNYRRKGIGTSLFNHINNALDQNELLVYNVQNSSAEAKGFIKNLNIPYTISQFEMKRNL
ncbi:GNAT family N-acetyltransferase [Flavobacterium sp. AJR]|uniref:GNAT family N-acetyltransferase n=1 Tax=Flavobacterium sp. AJR TaxID=1979369 RepID=UPI000A3D7501|nr:GNAT family N-acetyltransferase [Flavobacterium sp. AJR]OUL63231.1 GNAT family N-acetyltransferase [Flavobacterium sp. AJR]